MRSAEERVFVLVSLLLWSMLGILFIDLVVPYIALFIFVHLVRPTLAFYVVMFFKKSLASPCCTFALKQTHQNATFKVIQTILTHPLVFKF